jgi:hypothetical protein
MIVRSDGEHFGWNDGKLDDNPSSSQWILEIKSLVGSGCARPPGPWYPLRAAGKEGGRSGIVSDQNSDQIDANWVKVGTYPNAFSANSASALLTSIKIPNRLQYYGTVQIIECYIWVPRRFEVDAKQALNVTISDAELTAEALKEPPPDDA